MTHHFSANYKMKYISYRSRPYLVKLFRTWGADKMGLFSVTTGSVFASVAALNVHLGSAETINAQV